MSNSIKIRMTVYTVAVSVLLSAAVVYGIYLIDAPEILDWRSRDAGIDWAHTLRLWLLVSLYMTPLGWSVGYFFCYNGDKNDSKQNM